MSFEIEVVPTEKHFRALQRYAFRKLNRTLLGSSIRWFGPFALIGAIGLLLGIWVERPWMYVGVAIIGCGVVLASSIPLFKRVVYLRVAKTSLDSIRRKAHPGTQYQFTDAGVRYEAEFGFTFLKWRAFRKLFKSDDHLLLYLDEDIYLALPRELLNAEIVEFILEKCKESGVLLQV